MLGGELILFIEYVTKPPNLFAIVQVAFVIRFAFGVANIIDLLSGAVFAQDGTLLDKLVHVTPLGTCNTIPYMKALLLELPYVA